jgi:hypothetical protein
MAVVAAAVEAGEEVDGEEVDIVVVWVLSCVGLSRDE